MSCDGSTEAVLRTVDRVIEESARIGLACWWIDSAGVVDVEKSNAAFERIRPELSRASDAVTDDESAILIPVHRAGRVLGTLSVAAARNDLSGVPDRSYLEAIYSLMLNSPDSEQLLDDFTEHLAQAYENIQLLYRVGKAMSTPDDPAGFAKYLLDQTLESTPFRWAAIVFDDHPKLVESVSGHTFRATEIPGSDGLVGKEAERIALKFREQCGGIFYDADPAIENQGTSHLIQCGGEPVGMFVCGGKQGKEADISSYDTLLLEASVSHLGSVLQTARLYEDQAKMFLGTISSLIRALDAKDQYTRGHSDRVAALARQLALSIGVDEKTAERFHIAGLLHDVGKIGVPESVLCKPGRLTDDEFAFIMRHPEIGYRILDGVPGMEDLLPGVMHHHERYDGKGYPHGLAGEDIPLIARILCLADTFDAMSSNRAYRSAMTRETVLAEIEKCAGSQFDPELAPVFVGLDFSEYDRMVATHVRQAAIENQKNLAA